MAPIAAFVAVAVVVSLTACSGVSDELINEANRSVGKEFILGPEDVLEVNVWRNQDLSRTVVIRPDGKISLPLVGDVQASGLTATELADLIAKRLTEYKENPAVSVSVKEVNSYYIYVVGEVAKPGKYPLKSSTTVLQGLSLAGGFTPFASRNKMAVIRMLRNGEKGEKVPRQIAIPVPYDDLIKGQGPIGNFVLKSADTIVVP